jgi:hypothetical protein
MNLPMSEGRGITHKTDNLTIYGYYYCIERGLSCNRAAYWNYSLLIAAAEGPFLLT